MQRSDPHGIAPRLALAALTLALMPVMGGSAAAEWPAAPHAEASASGRASGRPGDDSKPSIVVDASKATFETLILRQGDQIHHRFDFKSGGGGPLVIERVIPNCGCLDPKLSFKAQGAEEYQAYTIGEPIPPNADVALDLQVDTLLKPDRSKLTTQLLTNASELPTTFVLIANVEPRFRVTPAGLVFGDFRADEERSGEIDIISTNGRPVRFTQDEASRLPLPPGMTFRFEPVQPDAEGRSKHWKLRVRLAAGMKEGPGGYRFLFVSDEPMPETPTMVKRRAAAKARGRTFGLSSSNFCVNILTNYRVLGDLEITPAVVSFGQMRAGQTLQQRVKLVATKPGIDLSKARAYIRGTLGLEVPLADCMSVKTRPIEGEDALEATVTITSVPAGFKGTIRCELAFDTGYEKKPLVRVPITGVVL
jgi:hypothetical protein